MSFFYAVCRNVSFDLSAALRRMHGRYSYKDVCKKILLSLNVLFRYIVDALRHFPVVALLQRKVEEKA
jgi:hypothetical protein